VADLMEVVAAAHQVCSITTTGVLKQRVSMSRSAVGMKATAYGVNHQPPMTVISVNGWHGSMSATASGVSLID
jgi:hypothetical protein